MLKVKLPHLCILFRVNQRLSTELFHLFFQPLVCHTQLPAQLKAVFLVTVIHTRVNWFQTQLCVCVSPTVSILHQCNMSNMFTHISQITFSQDLFLTSLKTWMRGRNVQNSSSLPAISQPFSTVRCGWSVHSFSPLILDSAAQGPGHLLNRIYNVLSLKQKCVFVICLACIFFLPFHCGFVLCRISTEIASAKEITSTGALFYCHIPTQRSDGANVQL